MMARTVDSFSQAQPGKCMHESRLGDLCGAGVLPFKQYYGGVDTALLFVMTAHAWWQRTGDDATMKELWPAVDLALDWISRYGDLDKDGFVKYTSDPGMGLANQGWKDSWDSIMFEDGEFATAPIALCEVQGYAYAAWRSGQEMAAKLGLGERSDACGAAADKLYKAIQRRLSGRMTRAIMPWPSPGRTTAPAACAPRIWRTLPGAASCRPRDGKA